MTDPTFDFSAFLTSPGGGSALAARAGMNKMDGRGAGRDTTAGAIPHGPSAADMSTVLDHGAFGTTAGAPSVGIFDTNNDLFDVPWDSLAPFADPLVAASVPPAEIDDPLLSAFTTNDILTKSRAQPFHGPMNANTSNDMVLDSNVPTTNQNGAPAGQITDAQNLPSEQQQPMFQTNGRPANNPSTSYRAQILAHHSHLMRNGLGGNSARNGLPYRPIHGSMISAPSVPLSQSAPSRAMQVADQAQQLSLQERRRQARMEQSKARKVKGTAENIQVSGRAQKRSVPGADTTMAAPTQQQQQQPIVQDLISEQQQMNGHGHDDSNGPIANPPDSVYSTSGFDMLKALMRVAGRPNPCVIIGPVDLSCSFTVSDAMHPDQPLIYCSDTFCRLTGYERSEIYGRNCRFLQSPDGIVEQGSERASTDNQAVAHLGKHVAANKECQASLINYRKDGQPFINLVTIVPITWDETNQIRYLVGFQVDLVEQPGAILEKMPDGSYFVNYSSVSVGIPPSVASEATAVAMVKQPSAITTVDPIDLEQQDAQARTANAQSIAEIIDGGHNDTKHWSKLLLDNSHDLIYVLSLKGTFLYVSPSVERILGYKPQEIIGKSISEFTHPSDVVPVFRELKDSTSNASIAAAARASRAHSNASSRYRYLPVRDLGPTVNLSFRMRTKDASHLWIESVGKLHLEQGKGRKVVVSSGRLRPQYHLASNVMATVASSKEPGFWSKISLDGLFLNVTAPVINMLGVTAHNMAGKTFKDLCDAESLGALSQALHTPATTLVLHALYDSMNNKVAVLSTFYPSSVPVESAHETVWVHIRRAPPKLVLQANVVYSSPEQEGDPNDASDPSVFAELSPYRSSSWCYELHQLRNLNKRLKEQVRAAHHRRTSISQVESSAINQSARLTDAAMKDMMYPASAFNPAQSNTAAAPYPRSAPAAHLMPPQDNRGRESSSSGDQSTAVDSLFGGSGSNTDSTRSTSMSTNATPSNGESSESASRGSASGGSSGEGAESEDRRDAAQAKLKPRSSGKRRPPARQQSSTSA